jgi:hypothetical protein
MSVLSFPRIYFQGYLSWDPCTFNNNDFGEDPTYAAAESSLNWSFLQTQGITPENFQTTFRPWAITLQPDPGPPSSPSGPAVPAEWNMFGSHAVDFVQYGATATTITGGAFGPTSSAGSGDPLASGPVQLANQGPPPVLVDTNPATFWTSQVYWNAGPGPSGPTGPQALNLSLGQNGLLSLPLSGRSYSRWLNLNRIYTYSPPLSQPASGVSCCFQTGIPFNQVTWPAQGVSALADALRQAASAPGAQGVMVRFTAYVNQYFQNGIFNNSATAPRNYTDLAADLKQAWQEWDQNGSTSGFFSNPNYSHLVGVVGVWNDGEPSTAPVGRYLVPQASVSPMAPVSAANQGGAPPAAAPVQEAHGYYASAAVQAASPGPATPLGPVVASVNNQLGYISLDFNSTIPEMSTGAAPPAAPSDLDKADFGPLSLGVLANGAVTPIGTIPYEQYGRKAYEASAGIIDVPLPPGLTGPSGPLQTGSLVITAMGQTALVEQNFDAQTDSRGIYLDQGGSSTFNVSVFQNGVPAPNANVLVARYGPGQMVPANYGNLDLVPAGPTAPSGATGPTVQVVNFTNGTQETISVGGISTGVTVVTADGSGVAQVGVAAQGPGFLTLGFYPYPAGGPTPTPPASLSPGPPWAQTITYADYTTVRVLTFDDALPQSFVDFWNGSQDPVAAWKFIYCPPPYGAGILYVYDMLFSVMLQYVNLGDPSAVIRNLPGVWSVTSAPSSDEGRGNMPITRDMSAGKRKTLQLWMYLVANNYNVPNFSVNSIPPGWSPTGPGPTSPHIPVSPCGPTAPSGGPSSVEDLSSVEDRPGCLGFFGVRRPGGGS